MRRTLFIYITQLNAEPEGWLLRNAEGQTETQQPGWPDARHAKNATVVIILGAEHSLCLPAQFPGRKNLNAWRKAAPWILEDHIADETSELHYAISPQAQDNGQYLVAASEIEPLQALLERAKEHHLEIDCITPDACLLPTNDNGHSSAHLGDRILLRDSSGACALPSAAAQAIIGEQPHWLDSGSALAALDGLSAEWNALNSMNLRQGHLAPGEAIAAKLRPWRSVAIAATVVAALWTGITAIQVNQLKSENAALQAEMTATFKAALPNSRMVKPRTQMQQALAGSQGGHSGGFLSALQTATQPLAAISDVKLSSLDQRGASLVLNLTATKISTVEQVRNAMSQLNGYRAEVGSVRADTDNVQLRVTVQAEVQS